MTIAEDIGAWLAQHEALLLAVSGGMFNARPLSALLPFKGALPDLLQDVCPNMVTRVEETKQLSNDDRGAFDQSIETYLGNPASEEKRATLDGLITFVGIAEEARAPPATVGGSGRKTAVRRVWS